MEVLTNDLPQLKGGKVNILMDLSMYSYLCGSKKMPQDSARNDNGKKGLVFLKMYESLKLCLWEYGQWKLARNLMQSIEIRRDSDIYTALFQKSVLYMNTYFLSYTFAATFQNPCITSWKLHVSIPSSTVYQPTHRR